MNYLTNINKSLNFTKEIRKKNATRSTVLTFEEDPVGYKIELIERDL